MSQAPPGDGNAFATSQSDRTTGDVRMGATSDGTLLEGMTPTYSIPMFGGEGYSRSPFAMADDFAAWLFNDAQFGPGASPMGYPGQGGIPNQMGGNANFSLQAPYFNHDPLVSGYFPPTCPASATSNGRE